MAQGRTSTPEDPDEGPLDRSGAVDRSQPRRAPLTRNRIHRTESRGKLGGLSWLAGQLRRQPTPDDRLSTRADRGPNGARLRSETLGEQAAQSASTNDLDRHRHPFDQVRYVLEGEYSSTPGRRRSRLRAARSRMACTAGPMPTASPTAPPPVMCCGRTYSDDPSCSRPATTTSF